MADEQAPTPDPRVIHLGMARAGHKGPGAYIGGVFKLRGDLDTDLRAAALDFVKAADRCLNGGKDEPGIEHLTVPGMVCAAFACELLLKFVLLRETGSHPRGHRLEQLFGQCSEEFRAEMERRMPGFSDLVVRNSTQFVDGRYHFEQPQFSFRQAELLLAAESLSECVATRFP
jgi:hypothetical protein